jgi:eukaryotic-like serine/threonine-protein kinase
MTTVADRHLLFGLLALQTGLINQGQLVAAFQAWTLDKSRTLAEHLESRGDLSGAKRTLLEALAEVHVEAHSGDVEKSLAAVPTCLSTRDSLARIGDPDVEATLGHVGLVHPSTQGEVEDPERTGSISVGSATSEGQRFRIVRPHARGGLGAVFVALDSELDREVALKQILDDRADDPTSRFRFLIEARITGGLEHPGIVPVYGLGSYGDGRPYYAMRFIRGDSLKEVIDLFHRGSKAGPSAAGSHDLALRKLLRRFMDVCNAIDYAHSRGVIHRDIKPANIIVGKFGETLVVDWGLAKPRGRVEPGTETGERMLMPSSASGSSETLPGSALGTPAYMSPEQAEGQLERQGPRSDVYSLGATLYYLLTGKPPFEGKDIGAVLHAVQKGDFPPPRAVDPAIDGALEAVCLKAMALRSEGRYISAKALADDVERWTADEPVAAWREPYPRRVRRWVRRNRTAVTAVAAMAMMALVGGAAVLAVQTLANGRLEASNKALREANVEVRTANDGLAAANRQVEERFALAMDAIKIFHTGVSEDFLLKEEKFKALRDRLLGSARDFYGRLGALLKGRSDRLSRQALATSYHELGDLTARIASIEEALAVHRKALALRKSLKDETFDSAEARADVAASLLAVGSLLQRSGHSAEAMNTQEEARTLLEATPTAGASDPRIRHVLGSCWGAIGMVQSSTGRPDDALASYGRARDIFEALVKSDPAVTKHQVNLALTHFQIGILFSATGHPEDALASYERARRIRDALVKANPTNPRYQGDLAASHGNTARLLAEIGRLDEAMASYVRAQTLYEALAKADPAVTSFQRNLALAHHSIGFSLSKTGHFEDALASYQRARRIREDLVRANPTDAQCRNDLASSFGNIGLVLSETSHPDEALASYDQARAIFDALAKADPAVTDFRLNLAMSHHYIGVLHTRARRAGDALASYGMARRILDKLARANPTVSKFRSELAATYGDIGLELSETGRPDEALASFRQARELLEAIVKDEPTVPEYRSDLALVYQDTGDLHAQAGRHREALVSYERASRISEELVRADPTVTKFQSGVATCYSKIGAFQAVTGDSGQALASYERARTIFESLAKANPSAADFRHDLASCITLIADAHRTKHRNDEALVEYDRAIVFRTALVQAYPTNSMYRAGLASTTRRLGLARLAAGDTFGADADFRRAAAILEALPPRSASEWYDLACCYAVAPDEADRAMHLLRRAGEAGYRNSAEMRIETALDRLRIRPDFQLLMIDLAFPAQPFARGD